MDHMSLLTGKVVLVTGASSGLGAETARLLSREGATVFGIARNADRLAALFADGGGIEGRKMDFTIHWDQGPVGQYTGDIDDDGFVTHGSTWDLTGPESHSRWSSPSQLGCVDAITPPPSPDPS
jgi:NAD(P)-dependent dehydrogenase (short-subunit alcohol dehydrogenase family)